MTERYLTITLQPDWKGALRAMAQGKGELSVRELARAEGGGLTMAKFMNFARSERAS